jgi:ABC-type antimicrobial peptide transport system permease subunit
MRLTTVDEIVDGTVANRRFYTIATATFAGIAFFLTTVGLIVVIARIVAERRRELAIRAALGATLAGLARHASRDAVLGVGLGALAGLGASYAAASLLRQFLYEVDSHSIGAYVSVAALMVSVAVIGVALPMRAFGRIPLASVLKAD